MNSLALCLSLLSMLLCHHIVAGELWEQRHHFGTKTPYYPLQDPSTYTPIPDKCHVHYVNLVARHGTREPTSGDQRDLSALESLLVEKKDAIINPDYAWLKEWKNPFRENEAGLLVTPGEQQHYQIALRMREEYPSIFNYSFLESRYFIESTQVSRAGRSANAFAYGLFEGKGDIGVSRYDPFFIQTYNGTLDRELRFFDLCTNYVEDIANNPSAREESTKYSEKMLPHIADKISHLLGGENPTWMITSENVEAMWSACVFEVSVQNLTDQFCTLFDEELTAIMDYRDDLKQYWLKSYGYPLNYEMACPLMQDMVDAFDKAIAYNGAAEFAPKADLRFAHAETVIPFLSLLGFYKESEPPMADSSEAFKQTRQWRSSVLAPFASNVAIVLYKCSGGQTYKVKVLHNEQEMQVPSCSGSIYCDYEEFKAIYQKPLTQCDFDLMCGISNDPCQSASSASSSDAPSSSSSSSSSSCNDEETDISQWNLTQSKGIMALVIGCLGGVLIGMLLSLLIFVIWQFVQRRNKGVQVVGKEHYNLVNGSFPSDEVVL
ncbi:Multiple inositol polyphosphate phosphatase 1 [Balamuthia mandrillaris]